MKPRGTRVKSDTVGYNGIGSDAVKAATGRSWAEWLTLLDRDGAREMTHARIAGRLSEKYGVRSWWTQMVTVGYEQARGLRAKHERPDGFQISGSRTLGVPLTQTFRAWSDARLRSKWLDADMTIRRATANKSMRITWTDGKTSVEVNFYGKGADKSLVTVQHSKLPDARAGEKMKVYWKDRLARLAAVLDA